MKCPESVAAVSHICSAKGVRSGRRLGLLSMIMSTKVRREERSASWWGELLGAKGFCAGMPRVRGLWCLCVSASCTRCEQFHVLLACISNATSRDSFEQFRVRPV